MIHRVNSLQKDPRFIRLLAIQVALFEFMCDPDNPLRDLKHPGVHELIRQSCRDMATAIWINRAPKLYNMLVEIVRYLDNHPTQRSALHQAFYNDFDYFNHLGDDTYSFQFFDLDENLRNLIQPLMEYLYDKLVEERGYPRATMLDTQHFNRGHMLKSWKVENRALIACPYCDGETPSEINDVSLSDADHFLPKSIYPFLALHPQNLVPVCLECNQRVKRDRDPLLCKDGSRSFRNTFTPYSTGAVEEVSIQCRRDKLNKLEISISERDGTVSTRVDSLNDILFLEQRWNSKLNPKVRSYREIIVMWIKRFKRPSNSTEEVRAFFADELQGIKIGTDAYLILRQSYIEYVLKNDDELHDLIST